MSPAPPVRIALVDDHALFRNILADMIDTHAGYEVVVQAGNGVEYQRAIGAGAEVDVAIVDLHMPVMDGYATLEWIRRTAPHTRALALTFEKTDEAMVRALRAGACGFLQKDVTAAIFKDALRQVVTLGHYHTDAMEQALDAHGEGPLTYARRREQIMERISDREAEFIELVCNEAEHTYDAIATRMNVHRRTLDGYRESLFEKFDLHSKTGLVIFAFKWGLVKGEDMVKGEGGKEKEGEKRKRQEE